MKTLHFDCFAGISGDMALGALVDLGVPEDQLRTELGKLGVTNWKLDFVKDQRNGITGTRALVTDLSANDHDHDHDPDHAPDHHHDHDHDHHDQEHHREHTHEHAHSSWKEIRSLIENSSIREGAKRRALDIFTRIAKAEAQVHGKHVDEVTFHEVGAIDSIIDIVGTAICLDILQPDRITASEIELGGGTVTCAHGVLPVPAPATLLLVQGLPVRTGGFSKEMTTPTGAAILAASVDQFISRGRFVELRTAYGIGQRKLDKPNVLRLSWREERDDPEEEGENTAKTRGWESEYLVSMEANVDDMTGEALGFLMESLFEAGALDVTLSPCVMKKNRPGTIVTVLSAPARTDELRRTLFLRSTTLGFREQEVRRLYLRREEATLPSPFGPVRAKTAFFDGQVLRTKVEYDDRARIARERSLSLTAVEEAIRNPGVPHER